VPPRHRAHVPDRAAVPGADPSTDNFMVGALFADTANPRQAMARAHDVLRRLDLYDKRLQLGGSLTLPTDRKRLEVAPRARPPSRSSLLL